jgi:hypothetical protein
VFDPVLALRLDGLIAHLTLLERPVEVRYRVRGANAAVAGVVVNGARLSLTTRESNPYRAGGWRVPAEVLSPLLSRESNTIEIEL